MIATHALLVSVILAVQADERPQGRIASRDPFCGVYCVYIALGTLGRTPADYEAFEKSFGAFSTHGYSMDTLETQAKKHDVQTLGVETSIANLKKRQEAFACIALINPYHYINVYDIDDEYVYVIDYPKSYKLPLATFSKIWSGKALLLSQETLAPESDSATRRIPPMTFAAAAGVVGLCAIVVAIWKRRNAARSQASAALVFVAIAASSVLGCGDATSDQTYITSSVPPMLTLEPAVHNLGTIFLSRAGEKIHISTKIHNRKNDPILIKEVRSSCTCTDVVVSSSRIMPHDYVTLSGTVRVGDFPQQKKTQIALKTSDETQSTLTVEIAWETVNPLRCAPEILEATSTQATKPETWKLDVFVAGITLCSNCRLQAESLSNALVVSSHMANVIVGKTHSHSTLKDDDETKIGEVIVIPSLIDHEGYDGELSIRIVCGTEQRARSAVPVHWSVKPPIEVLPVRLSWGLIGPGASRTRRVVVRASDGKRFNIETVRATTPGLDRKEFFEFKVFDVTPSEKELEIELTAPKDVGYWRSSLTIVTDRPDCNSLNVPISAVVGRE